MTPDLHYTKDEMVKALLPFAEVSGSVLDAGSGRNKVWFNSLEGEKYQCELEDGCDFYKWAKEVDWVIGNPPYHESWKFTEKAILVARKGIAWLVNNQALNSHLNPRRLELLKSFGFFVSKIVVVQDKRWFGRYYFIVLSKNEGCDIKWITKTF